MDKYVTALKKHHFWLLSAVVVLASLVVWSTQTSNLQARYQADKQRVASAFRSVGEYEMGNHPNESFKAEVEKVHDTLKSQVLDTWRRVYEHQSQLLKWPQAVADIGELPPTADIPPARREFYRNNVIEPTWNAMFAELRLRRQRGGPGRAPGGIAAAPDSAAQWEGILAWNEAQRDDLKRRYMTQVTPSTLRVRLTQEDIWIFQSLFDVIKTVNANSRDAADAVIKRIDYLDIAQYAMQRALRDPGDIRTDAAPSPPATGGPAGFSVTDEGPAGDTNLLDGRYLDENCRPVSEDAARNSPPFAEFKQVFVQMNLLVSQGKLHELFAACANSVLPIEIRQVRMNLAKVDGEPAGIAGAAPGLAPIGGGEMPVERRPDDIEVEIRGIIFIYNPPDENTLGTGSAPNPAQRTFGIPVASE